MKRFAWFCLIPALLTGCVTRPIALADAVPTPPDRVFAYNKPIDGPSGQIVVVRDAGLPGAACPFGFYIDGQLAAHLRRAETTTLIVPAGDHILGVGPAGTGVCDLVNVEARRRETTVMVEPNGIAKIRLAVTQDGTYLVTPTAF